MSARVAVLGAGIMGAGMAERLLEQGFAVDVWDRTPAVADRLREHGALPHADAVGAVKTADVVITMLPTGEVVTDVMITRGTLAAMRANSVWAQMGTLGLAATEDLAAEVAARRADVAFVDAPVSGTRDPARTGQLTILPSGPEATRATLEPVFAALGRKVLWVGDAGQGTRLKLVLNTWLAFEVEAAAEVSAAAQSLGVPYETLLAAVDGGALPSGTSLARLAKMENNDHSPQFPLEWALKDLDLVEAATGPGALPVAGAIAGRWRGLVAQGLGRLDVSAARFGLDGDDDAQRGRR